MQNHRNFSEIRGLVLDFDGTLTKFSSYGVHAKRLNPDDPNDARLELLPRTLTPQTITNNLRHPGKHRTLIKLIVNRGGKVFVGTFNEFFPIIEAYLQQIFIGEDYRNYVTEIIYDADHNTLDGKWSYSRLYERGKNEHLEYFSGRYNIPLEYMCFVDDDLKNIELARQLLSRELVIYADKDDIKASYLGPILAHLSYPRTQPEPQLQLRAEPQPLFSASPFRPDFGNQGSFFPGNNFSITASPMNNRPEATLQKIKAIIIRFESVVIKNPLQNVHTENLQLIPQASTTKNPESFKLVGLDKDAVLANLKEPLQLIELIGECSKYPEIKIYLNCSDSSRPIVMAYIEKIIAFGRQLYGTSFGENTEVIAQPWSSEIFHPNLTLSQTTDELVFESLHDREDYKKLISSEILLIDQKEYTSQIPSLRDYNFVYLSSNQVEYFEKIKNNYLPKEKSFEQMNWRERNTYAIFQLKKENGYGAFVSTLQRENILKEISAAADRYESKRLAKISGWQPVL